MSELELKFQVPAEVVPALRAELKRRGAQATSLAALYFDTPDFALGRARIALRLRREGTEWVQTLKASGRSAVDRLEHNVPRGRNGSAPPQLDLDLHRDSEAGAALRDAIGKPALATLAQRYGTEVTRLACDLRIDGMVVEAAFDEGTIGAGSRTERICELELERKSGAPDALFEIAKAWSDYAGLCLNTRSKAMRGVLLAQGKSRGPAVKARKPRLPDMVSGPQFLRSVLRSTLDQVLANASEIADSKSSDVDEEHVHQLRVGLRRLRTALRELGPLDRGVDPRWEAPLAHAFAHLGEARDAVTARRVVRPLLEHTQAPLYEWKMAAPPDPVATVHDHAFQATLLDLLHFALKHDAGVDSAEAAAEAHAHLLGFLAKRLSRLRNRMRKAAGTFECMPIDEQHRARKQLKRLRYLAEFAAPLAKGKAAKRFLECLEPAQDALGRHVDIAVAMAHFRTAADTDLRAMFAARYLEAYLGNTARIAQSALREVAQARRFW